MNKSQQLPLTVQNGSPSHGQSWIVFYIVAVTWTVILVCITLTMYKSEECQSKWEHIRSGLTGAVANVQILKQQNEELRSLLTELSRLQLLDIKNRLKNSDQEDLLQSLILKTELKKESLERKDAPLDLLRLKLR